MNIRKFFSSVTGDFPTLVTFLLLGSVVYVGYRTNWALPRSAVFGQTSVAKDDWCADHGVPESTCVQCKGIAVSSLGTTSPSTTTAVVTDWCDEHGVPESVCTRCNPSLIEQFKKQGDWCNSHAVPESQCIKCNPDVKAKLQAMAPRHNATPVATQPAVDWCQEHGVPRSVCTRCEPSLIAGFKAKGDWCGGHNVPESQCIKCNPELKKKLENMVPKAPAVHPDANNQQAMPVSPPVVDWCASHGVPESVCTRCNSDLIPKFKAQGDWCKEHDLPESQCIRCNPSLKEKFQKMAPQTQAGADRIIQLASPQVARQAGIEAQSGKSRSITQHVEVNAEVRYDMTRYAQVSPRTGGTVVMVCVRLGQSVKRGEVLALIDAAEVGRAKAEFLASAATLAAKKTSLDRVRVSTEQGFRNKSELQAAEAEIREATIKLFNARQTLVNLGFTVPDLHPGEIPEEHSVQLLGLPDTLLKNLDAHRTSANLIPLVSPLDGVIVNHSATEAEVVETASPLFIVADTTHMSIKLDLPLGEIARVRKGQEVTFTADGLEQPVVGQVTWISTEVDDRTRTVEVRADVPNRQGHLLANMFGRASLSITTKPNATVISTSALQWDGINHLVFLKISDTLYTARVIHPGLRDADGVEVTEITPHDHVVVSGTYSLLSQLNRSKLGAGCADEH